MISMSGGRQVVIAVLLLWVAASHETTALALWGPLRPSHQQGSSSHDGTTNPLRLVNVDLEGGPMTALANGSSHLDSNLANSDQLKTVDVLSLDSIRSTLIRQEETIIFALIERAQYRQNLVVYERGGFGALGVPIGSVPPEGSSDDPDSDAELSFMEYVLVGTEALHYRVRRYTSPEEHAFFPERLPHGQAGPLPPLQYPSDLLSSTNNASHVNFNKRLLQLYIDAIVPAIAKKGDDEQHGSTVLCDIAVLQALSKRVHYGKFVAESKYRSDPRGYQRLVDDDDADGVMELLTNQLVEAQVIRRARLKAATYGTEPLLTYLPTAFTLADANQDMTNIVAAAAASAVVAALEAMGPHSQHHQQGKVDPSVIEGVYRDIIIPMTKDIEVAYLFLRCGKQPPPRYMP